MQPPPRPAPRVRSDDLHRPLAPGAPRFRVSRCSVPHSVVLLLVLAGGVQAQDTPSDPSGGGVALGQLPMSTRSLGLAGAVSLAHPDPDGFLRNPALAERARGVGMTMHRYDHEARVVSMAGGAPWLGGGVGLGLRSVSYPVAASGARVPAPRAGDRMRLDTRSGEATVPVTETALTAGYGRVWKGVRFGAAASALEVRRGGASRFTGFLDIGAAMDVGPVTLGVSGGGLGPSMDLPTGFRRVPGWVMVGAGTRAAPVGPLDISGALAATLVDGDRLEAGGGLEFGWWPIQGRTLVGRVGLGGSRIRGASQPSLGAAFLGDSFTLEYAWREVNGGRGLHGVTLRFR